MSAWNQEQGEQYFNHRLFCTIHSNNSAFVLIPVTGFCLTKLLSHVTFDVHPYYMSCPFYPLNLFTFAEKDFYEGATRGDPRQNRPHRRIRTEHASMAQEGHRISNHILLGVISDLGSGSVLPIFHPTGIWRRYISNEIVSTVFRRAYCVSIVLTTTLCLQYAQFLVSFCQLL